MTANQAKITDRYMDFVDSKKMPDKVFGKEIGASIQTMTNLRTRKIPIRGVTLMKTMVKFPELNGNWVVHGTGKMQITSTVHAEMNRRETNLLKETVELYKEKIAFLEQQLEDCKEKINRHNN